MPGSVCAVKVCHNNRKLSKKFGKDIHYHSFPKDPVIRQKWIEKCGRVNFFNPNTSQVCSVHFTPDDYVRDLRSELLNLKPKHRLKPGAIPSLHLDITVEWYPSVKVNKKQKVPPMKKITDLSRKNVQEEDHVTQNLNQVFLPEVNAITIKDEKDTDEQEKEIVMTDAKEIEFDPLNPYDILLEKYNHLLKENLELKRKLNHRDNIITKQHKKIELLLKNVKTKK